MGDANEWVKICPSEAGIKLCKKGGMTLLEFSSSAQDAIFGGTIIGKSFKGVARWRDGHMVLCPSSNGDLYAARGVGDAAIIPVDVRAKIDEGEELLVAFGGRRGFHDVDRNIVIDGGGYLFYVLGRLSDE